MEIRNIFICILTTQFVQMECRITRREFGDIGDEVSTNLPIRKSYIPQEYREPERKNIQKKSEVETSFNNNLTPTKTLVHHFNPIYHRDFLTVETKPYFKNHNIYGIQNRSDTSFYHEKKNIIENSANLNLNEMNSLKQTDEPVYPSSELNWYKRSFIPNRHKILPPSVVKYLHKKWHQENKKNIVINPLMKRAFYKHIDKNAASRSYINSRPGLLPYAFRPHSRGNSLSRSVSSSFLQDKKSILKRWRNNLFRQSPLHEIDRKRKYHHYRKASNDNRTVSLIKQANKYHDNSLLKELSQVTMKWTGVKDSATVNASTLPPWFSTLKKVIQPKVRFRSSKHLMKGPIEKQRLNAAAPVDKAKMKAIMSSIYPSPKIAPLEKDVYEMPTQPVKPKVVEMKAETKINTDETKNNSLTVKKQQMQLYQGFSISSNPTQPSSSSYYPSTSYPTYNNYFAHHEEPPLNFVPWNYYHSEYLPDGRIRPALYPIAKHIPYGRCLPENSLCDLGHDEQCCGSSTFCVNYWGLNKCLPFRKVAFEEEFDPYQIQNDKYYKNYYNYYLANVKASSGLYMKRK